jgi:hypothetical protein
MGNAHELSFDPPLRVLKLNAKAHWNEHERSIPVRHTEVDGEYLGSGWRMSHRLERSRFELDTTEGIRLNLRVDGDVYLCQSLDPEWCPRYERCLPEFYISIYASLDVTARHEPQVRTVRNDVVTPCAVANLDATRKLQSIANEALARTRYELRRRLRPSEAEECP